MVSGNFGNDPISGQGRNRSMQNSLILVEQFKNVFRSLQEADLSRLRFVYADDVVFRDTVREIRGLVALEDHFAALHADLADFKYEFVDQLISDRAAYLKWVLHYRPRSVSSPAVSFRGVSHLNIGERIEFQENFYHFDQQSELQSQRLGAVSRWFGKRPTRKSISLGS